MEEIFGELQRLVPEMKSSMQKFADPRDKAMLLGCALANLLGPMSEKEWLDFSHLELNNKPCGRPGCECHIARKKLFEGLVAIRADWRKVMRLRRN